MCLFHVIRDDISIDVHRRANIGMPHEPSFDCYSGSDSTEPRAVGAAKSVGTELTYSRRDCRQVDPGDD
jgi:hypothetical protein